jgi:hypothetical protein
MSVTLKPHQKEFAEHGPDKAILAWSVRTGKSFTALAWAEKRPAVKFLLVCPKRIKGDWLENVKEYGSKNVTVCTKEEFKNIDLSLFTGIIIDEAHHFASGLFDKKKKIANTKKRKFAPSDLTAILYNWIRLHPEYPVLLMTATPISSKPSNLHTLAALTGHFWDWKQYQNHFYELVRRPYAPFPFWEKKEDWRQLIKPFVRKVCNIKLLSEVSDAPEPIHNPPTKVTLTPETRKAIKEASDLVPSKEWHMKHRLAQGKEKLSVIRDLSDGIPKVIVVVSYTSEVDYYLKELSKDREVFVLDGRTKNPRQIILDAADSDESYFIMQADCAEGFRGDSFNKMIFASMSWKVVSYQQALGRMQHMDKEVGIEFDYLLADDKDKDIYGRVVIDGRDFSLAGIKANN